MVLVIHCSTLWRWSCSLELIMLLLNVAIWLLLTLMILHERVLDLIIRDLLNAARSSSRGLAMYLLLSSWCRWLSRLAWLHSSTRWHLLPTPQALQLLDALNDLNPVKPHLDIQIIFQVRIRDEVKHRTIECQLNESLFVLRKSKRLLQPQNSVIGAPSLVLLPIHQLFDLG